jgi:hypothetical protein
MSNSRSLCACLLVILSPLLARVGLAETAADPAAAVIERDRLFWKSYNECDLDAMPQYLADDLEFYHDQGGIMLGGARVVGTIRDSLCSNPARRLRREAGATVRASLLRDGGVLYGAVITGDHTFYVRENGGPERADSAARFTELWLLRNGQWKLARVLSYDHGPAAQGR